MNSTIAALDLAHAGLLTTFGTGSSGMLSETGCR